MALCRSLNGNLPKDQELCGQDSKTIAKQNPFTNHRSSLVKSRNQANNLIPKPWRGYICKKFVEVLGSLDRRGEWKGSAANFAPKSTLFNRFLRICSGSKWFPAADFPERYWQLGCQVGHFPREISLADAWDSGKIPAEIAVRDSPWHCFIWTRITP